MALFGIKFFFLEQPMPLATPTNFGVQVMGDVKHKPFCVLKRYNDCNRECKAPLDRNRQSTQTTGKL
jgi:hypothetical protein